MSKPLISVVVPVYNTAYFLPNCIESILHQSYAELELILVDDGSTDNCLEICRRYEDGDHRVRVFTQQNRGQSMARNLALDCMKGQYVCFVDSDDEIVPDALEKQMNAIQHYQADVAICGVAFDNGLRISAKKPYESVRLFNTEDLLREYVSTDCIHSGVTNKLFRAEIFWEIRFPDVRKNEDMYILHELLGQCRRAVHVNECLYVQHIRAGSLEKSTFSPRTLAIIEGERRVIAYFRKNYPEMLSLVVFRKADALAGVMSKIAEDFVYFRYCQCYKELKKELEIEYRTAVESSKEASSNGRTKLAFEHPVLFFCKYSIRGVYKRVRMLAGWIRRHLKNDN